MLYAYTSRYHNANLDTHTEPNTVVDRHTDANCLSNHHTDPNRYGDVNAHSYTNIHTNANVVAHYYTIIHNNTHIVADQHADTSCFPNPSDGHAYPDPYSHDQSDTMHFGHFNSNPDGVNRATM